MALDLFNKNRPKYLYADKKEQEKRVNHALTISYSAFYLLFAILLLVNAANGVKSFGFAILFSLIAFVAFASGVIITKFKPDAYAYRVVSFLWLVIFSVVTSFVFDSYFFRFMMMIPMVGAIFFFDKKYTIITSLVLGIAPILVSIAKIAMGSFETMSDIVNDMTASIVVLLFGVVIFLNEKLSASFNDDTINKVKAEQEEQAVILENVLRVASQVREGTGNVMTAVDKLTEATGIVTGEVKGIAANSLTTAENIQTQTHMTQDIQEAITKTLEHSGDMRIVAEQTIELNQASSEIMSRMTNQAESISETNSEVANTMESLRHQAKAVQGIADTIFSISSQTNLLALNASIEAARAGEAGKGFAVVADEIRALADNTRNETENIAKILNELSDNAERAMVAVDNALRATGMQEELIGQAVESFQLIEKSVSDLTENIAIIDGMLEGLSKSNNMIVDNISQLSATSEEVSASTINAEELSGQNLTNADETKNLLDSIMEVSKKLDRYVESEEV